MEIWVGQLHRDASENSKLHNQKRREEKLSPEEEDINTDLKGQQLINLQGNRAKVPPL